MVCLGFEPGPQDGRLRRNHGAMAATSMNLFILSSAALVVARVLKCGMFSVHH